MSAQPKMTMQGSDGAVIPVLRTLLIADLADSTGWIEQMGDSRAAILLQRLDLQIRDLIEFTGGRLIDKADGLLALFERPVQAVDFGLRYQRALLDMGQKEGLALKARIGIHVGEVMTWENSPSAVAAGAKPLEVEGLAKPVAARLMSLALPGQILLSGMAQNLAQRAQLELGERAGKLRWLVHGRYRFKGVPAPMLVHEVGEAGLSPLRAPPSGQKAWREVPFWRRPPVLAAEALVLVGLIGGSLYTVFKSPPAIAFHERDWVVVGDLSNFTADPRLEDSLETALRISLEQSRFVNVLPQTKVDGALQRMGRSRQSTVDRAVGSEIALREGARALLLPSIAEVGGKLRVSVEIVDPNNEVTVYAQSTEGRGAESVLASLDTVTEGVREKLGESLGDIQANGRPLAQITTPSLDALRLYTAANDAAMSYKFEESLRLLNLAIERDPEFALAYSSRARLHLANNDRASALADLRLANKYRNRLSTREALTLDTGLAEFGPPESLVNQWQAFAQMYPDAYRAHFQVAFYRAFYFQQYEQALAALQPSMTNQNPRLALSMHLAGMINLAMERYAQSKAQFENYESLGGHSFERVYADLYAAQRQFPKAEAILERQKRSGMVGADLDMRLPEITYPLDQGQWRQALSAAGKLKAIADSDAQQMSAIYQGTILGLRSYEEGLRLKPELRKFAEGQAARAVDPGSPDAANATFLALYGASGLARLGDTGAAEKVLAEVKESADRLGYPAVDDMKTLVEAELLLAHGKAAEAVALASARVNGEELNAVHAFLLRACRAAGMADRALTEAKWLAGRRGRAYIEWNSQYVLQPINVLESDLAILAMAELQCRRATDGAQQSLALFARAWPTPPGFVVNRIADVKQELSRRKGRTD